MRAWLMIRTKRGPSYAEKDAENQIRMKFSDIENVNEVFGQYDITVEVQAMSVDVIYEKYIKGINALPAIEGITTYLAVGSPKTKEVELKKPKAYALIDASPELMDYVRDKIFEFDEVQKCDLVLGQYDVLAEIVTPDLENLKRLINSISKLNGVNQTATLVATT